MDNSFVIGDVFQIDSKWIKESRELLIKMLSETVDIDFPKKDGKDFALRFYQMTKEEYNMSQSFCFKAIFDNFEAYCYDSRMLLNERYLTFDSQVSFLPIILSGKRWDKINQMYGAVMKKVLKKDPITGDYVNGIFLWPLFNEERMALFRNANTKPVICMKADTFELKSELNHPSLFKDVLQYVDKSPTERFFPKNNSTSQLNQELDEQDKKQIDETWIAIQKRILSQITTFKLTQEDWDLFQAKAKPMFISMLHQAEETQIVGSLLLAFMMDYYRS